MRRITMPITDKAHANLGLLKEKWGLSQQAVNIMILENMTPDTEPFASIARETSATKNQMRDEIGALTANILTLEQFTAFKKALKDAGIDVK